jgi:hypothetical protein
MTVRKGEMEEKLVARQILGRQKGANRQIIVITDGEPTAHFDNGHLRFSYPPTPRTFQETLREVIRCTRNGITMTCCRRRSCDSSITALCRLPNWLACLSETEASGLGGAAGRGLAKSGHVLRWLLLVVAMPAM